ncbi:MAG: hypothetical protein GF398_00745 [Chitinivibrionales bacterium]|nr:hypothetical protein [Chitinivibrionales bacterium]
MSGSLDSAGSAITIAVKNGIAVLSFPDKVFQKRQAEAFKAYLAEARQHNFRLILDLSDCAYISSDGLGATARCWKLCNEDNLGRMAIVFSDATDDEVRHLFEIIGLTRVVGAAIYPSVDEAISHLNTRDS